MKTHAWQRSIGAWLFVPAVYFAVTSSASLLWYIPALLVYLTIALTVTVGYHRLFTHNAFVCSRIWHWFFGLVGCISLNSAPVHWSSVHITHHKFADTEEDPYDPDWRHFFRFKDRENVKATKNELRLMRDKMHLFFINNSFTLSIITGVILAAFGVDAFLFLYALPITTYLVTSGLHTIFAHGKPTNMPGKTAARNVWLMEFIIPMGGEWIHREHHEKPKLNNWHTKPYYFDMGGILIGLIERNDQQAT